MHHSEEKYLQELCKNIKRIRKEKGMTQKDVADGYDNEEAGFRRIENGRTNPTFKTLIMIERAMNVDIVELFNFSDLEEF